MIFNFRYLKRLRIQKRIFKRKERNLNNIILDLQRELKTVRKRALKAELHYLDAKHIQDDINIQLTEQLAKLKFSGVMFQEGSEKVLRALSELHSKVSNVSHTETLKTIASINKKSIQGAKTLQIR